MKNKLKLILTIGLIMLFCAIGLTACVKSDTEGFELSLINNETEYSVIKYKGVSTEVIIPTEYKGKPVTRIGSNAFSGCSSLTSITIPDSITCIEANAFVGCSALQYYKEDGLLYLGNGNNRYLCLVGVESEDINVAIINKDCKVISSRSFYGCNKLESITVPFIGASLNDETDNHLYYIFGVSIENVGTAFKPKKVYHIPSTLKTVVITGGESIGPDAFAYCSSLTSITIPDSVTSIGEDVFGDCDKLERIEVDENNKNYLSQDGILYNKVKTQIIYALKTIKGAVVIPDTITSIGSNTFSGCSSLTNITIPDSVTSIGEKAFAYCLSLTSIIIPDSVTSIGEEAFFGCKSLSSITIPDSVTDIGDSAFSGCYKLEKVNYTGEINDWARIEFGSAASNPLYITKNLYINDKLVTEVNLTTANRIADCAFYNCTSLTIVTIGNNVQSIGVDSFTNCSGLASITIGNNVQSIGSDAFIGCSSLTNITIPDSVTSIGEKAFAYCSSLTSITIPDSVTKIGKNAFAGCSALQYNKENGLLYLGNSNNKFLYLARVESKEITNATINLSCKSIEYEVFYGCNKLESITVPFIGASLNDETDNHLYYIFGVGFENVGTAFKPIIKKVYHIPSTLKTVVITGGESIGPDAFAYCSSLTSITIPDSVTKIGKYAFSGCNKLEKVNYTGEIDDWARIEFGSASSNPLYITKNLYINDKLVTEVNLTTANRIADCAFYNCTSLTIVTIGNNVQSIGSDAFIGCSSLTKVTIPESVTKIGKNAFSDCNKLEKVNYTGEINDWARIEFGSAASNPLYITKNLYINDKLVTEVNLTTANRIADYAFYNCTSLTIVTIGNNVQSIGVDSFTNCSGLASITIGNNVQSIGSDAFAGCRKLLEVINKSGLDIKKGNEGYGRIGYYALSLKTEGTRDVVIKDNYLFITYNETKYLFGFAGTQSVTSLILPENYNGVSYEVLAGAFDGCKSLESITIPFVGATLNGAQNTNFSYIFGGDDNIPSSLKKVVITGGNIINSNAFSGCSSIESITIPNSVTSIGKKAFFGCKSLKSITIPFVGATLNGAQNTNFSYIFGGNGNIPSSLKKVVITGGDKIEDLAFYDCSSLTSIIIPDSVTSIGEKAFFGCKSLTSIIIPDSVTSIGFSAFYDYNMSLESITIPFVGATLNGAQNTNFSYIFGGDDNIPSSLKKVVITGGNIINSNAFSGCSSLTSIIIPDSVTSIGEKAFFGCKSLSSITIPDSVTDIGDSAFSGCYKLENVNYTGEIDDWVQIEGLDNLMRIEELYSYVYERKLFINDTLVTEVNLTTANRIADYAFFKCSYLNSVTIPVCVTSIGEDAFTRCSITSVNYLGTLDELICFEDFNKIKRQNAILYLNNKVVTELDLTYRSVLFGTFGGFESIKTVIIGGRIGDRAFSGCSLLSNLTILNGVYSIGDYAFSGCSSLTSLTIPGSVKSIGDYAFANCYESTAFGLKKVIMNNGITSIGLHAFEGCKMLTDVVMPDSIQRVGEFAFEGCISLKYNSLNNRSKYLGNSTHPYLCLLKGVVGDDIHVDCRIIYYAAYKGSDSGNVRLKNITIPKNVMSISAFAFRFSEFLESVTFENTTGWFATRHSRLINGTNVDVTNSRDNASLLQGGFGFYRQ